MAETSSFFGYRPGDGSLVQRPLRRTNRSSEGQKICTQIESVRVISSDTTGRPSESRVVLPVSTVIDKNLFDLRESIIPMMSRREMQGILGDRSKINPPFALKSQIQP